MAAAARELWIFEADEGHVPRRRREVDLKRGPSAPCGSVRGRTEVSRRRGPPLSSVLVPRVALVYTAGTVTATTQRHLLLLAGVSSVATPPCVCVSSYWGTRPVVQPPTRHSLHPAFGPPKRSPEAALGTALLRRVCTESTAPQVGSECNQLALGLRTERRTR